MISKFSRYKYYLSVLFRGADRVRFIVQIVGGFVLSALDAICLGAIAPLVSAMSGNWNTGLAGRFADMFGLTTQTQVSGWLLAIAVGGIILKDLISMGFSWWASTFVARSQVRAQMLLTEYYLRLPYSEHNRLGLATILRKSASSVGMAYGGFALAIIGVANQIFSVVLVSVMLIAVTPIVAIVLVLALVLSALMFIRMFRPMMRRIGDTRMELSERAYSSTFDAFGAIKEVQLRGAYDLYFRHIEEPTMENTMLGRTVSYLGGLPKQIMEVFFMLTLLIIFVVQSALDSSGSFLPTIAILAASGFRLLPTIAALVGSFTNINSSEPGTEECVESLLQWRAFKQTRAYTNSLRGDGHPVALTQQIEVKDLHFRYPGAQAEVLRGINFTVKKGQSVALVGSSGAGKSTMVDIIMGLQTPTSGQFLVDGVDISHDLWSWRREIAVVPQQVFLVDLSIAENVAFDQERNEIDEDRVIAALKRAQMWEFAEAQPEGIWSRFGERGKRLSGGQVQRIGIARALYRQPSVLILDEATSALDNETEAKIAETVDNLGDDITRFVVAHRLSTIKNADLIIFLADGLVAGSGTFSELYRANETFKRLVDLGDLSQAIAGN